MNLIHITLTGKSGMFDFDTPVDRTHSDSHKWHKYADRDIIPMWVADMDFQSPPAVMEALHQRVAHGVFGYGRPDPLLKATIIDHLQTAYGWPVAPEWLVWLPGLVTGINVACRSVGRRGAVIATTVPVYPPFLSAPRLAGKKLRTSRMISSDEQWQFDWDGLQEAVSERSALYLLCNPQNPTGRVFTRKELEALADICLQAGAVICADEIHCDLILETGARHLPFALLAPEVADRTITLMAPSKSFNLPGLGCAFAVISNAELRQAFKRAMEGIVPHVNVLGLTAAQAAYRHGGPWLSALLDYLRGNRDMTRQRINATPGLQMGPVEGTYLAWIDTRDSGIEAPVRFLENGGVGLSDGTGFGMPGFVRLNFACPRWRLADALDRIRRAMGVDGPLTNV